MYTWISGVNVNVYERDIIQRCERVYVVYFVCVCMWFQTPLYFFFLLLLVYEFSAVYSFFFFIFVKSSAHSLVCFHDVFVLKLCITTFILLPIAIIITINSKSLALDVKCNHNFFFSEHFEISSSLWRWSYSSHTFFLFLIILKTDYL